MNSGTVFYTMTGSGNDFVMFDGRHLKADALTAQAITAICDRRLGIGADGVGLLEPTDVPGARFFFRFWNSDGSPGPMCGNGALCVTRLAALLELATPDGEVAFATVAGTHRGRVVTGKGAGPDEAEIQLPDCAPPRPAAISTLDGEEGPMLVQPSVPHLVLRVGDVDRVSLEERGPKLRRDPATGEGGANVNWVSPREDGSWRMRTFERGVEGETLACGTGAVACALSLAAQGLAQSPVRIATRSGLTLTVTWREGPAGVREMRLRGEGRLVYRGILGHVASSSRTNG